MRKKKMGGTSRISLRSLFPCEVFAREGRDWLDKATRTSTTLRVYSQISVHTHAHNTDTEGGKVVDAVHARCMPGGNITYQLHKSLIERVKARIDSIHFIPATVRRSQQKGVWIQVPVRYHMCE
jgi:hypothetical protein